MISLQIFLNAAVPDYGSVPGGHLLPAEGDVALNHALSLRISWFVGWIRNGLDSFFLKRCMMYLSHVVEEGRSAPCTN